MLTTFRVKGTTISSTAKSAPFAVVKRGRKMHYRSAFFAGSVHFVYEYSVFSTHSSMLNVAWFVPSVSRSRKISVRRAGREMVSVNYTKQKGHNRSHSNTYRSSSLSWRHTWWNHRTVSCRCATRTDAPARSGCDCSDGSRPSSVPRGAGTGSADRNPPYRTAWTRPSIWQCRSAAAGTLRSPACRCDPHPASLPSHGTRPSRSPPMRCYLFVCELKGRNKTREYISGYVEDRKAYKGPFRTATVRNRGGRLLERIDHAWKWWYDSLHDDDRYRIMLLEDTVRWFITCRTLEED